MVTKWRLKLICICVLLTIAALLSNQINLTFSFTPNENTQHILNSEADAKHHHNKLSFVKEFVVQDKRLKFGFSHSVVIDQSKYKQYHISRQKNGNEVGGGNSENYSKHSSKDMSDHMFELIQVTLDNIVSSWNFNKLSFRVEVDCWVSENGGHSRFEEGVLKVCLSPSLLMKEYDTKGLSKEHLKLLALKYILNELRSDNALLIRSNIEAREETEEFNRKIARVISDLSLKLNFEGNELMKGPNPSTHSVVSLNRRNVMPSQLEPAHHLPSPALISQRLLPNLALSNIAVPDNAHHMPPPALISHRLLSNSALSDIAVPDTAPAHHMPPPALISHRLLSNSALRDIAVRNNAGQIDIEQRSHMVQEPPSQKHLIQEPADQHTAQTKIQELRTSHSNFRHPRRRKKARPVLVNIPNLEGYMIKGNKSLLDRGFHTDYGFDSPELLKRRKFISAALEGASVLQRDVARVSLNTNLLERGKYQHEQILRYCKSENLSAFLPGNYMELNVLFKHLLYDDSKKIVFCYVPKNGCSNMKRMMLILNGIIPANSSQGSRPSESVLGSVHSFRNLRREEAIYKLENYFKFSILRHPIERLLSAYRNKLEKPLNFLKVNFFPDCLKAFILTLEKKSALQKWVALKNYSIDIHPSFSDTLNFMTKFTLTAYNEHFLSFLKLCHPCAIKYDLFLNLKSMNYDIFALMEYMRIPLQYFPDMYKSSVTRDHLEEYYQQVSPNVKSRVFNTFAKELEFYYDMHPEEL